MVAGQLPGADDRSEFTQVGYWDWLEAVARDPAVHDRMARWLALLVRYQDGLSGRNVCIPAGRISQRLGVAQRTVERWTEQLVDAGYLVRVGRPAPNRAATFMLFAPPTPASAERASGGRTPANATRKRGGRDDRESPAIAERDRGERGGRTPASAERDRGVPKHFISTSTSSGREGGSPHDSDDDDLEVLGNLIEQWSQS